MSWQKKVAEKYPFIGSSEDPDKLSRTLVNSVPTLLLILGAFKIDIPQTDLETYALAIAAVINGLRTLYFAGLRVYAWWQHR